MTSPKKRLVFAPGDLVYDRINEEVGVIVRVDGACAHIFWTYFFSTVATGPFNASVCQSWLSKLG